MKQRAKIVPIILTLTAVLASCRLEATEKTKNIFWSYHGATGPEEWGKLHSDFLLCRIGRNQSPIDIRREQVLRTDLRPLEFQYEAALIPHLVMRGYMLEIVVPGDRFRLRAEGENFQLVSVQFHTPSEHTDGGSRYPMEAHFVHHNARGELAIVGVWFRSGEENPVLTQLLQLAQARGEEKNLASGSQDQPKKITPHAKRWEKRGREPVDLRRLLPVSEGFFRYAGSLTAPPCTEGVRWYVMQEPVAASEAQLQAMRAMIGENARPTQPLWARRVLE